MRNRPVLAAAAVMLAAAGSYGQTVPANFTASTLATGMPNPTAMAVAPNGDVYICQQGGALRVLQGVTLGTVNTFTVHFTGERGLLGVALDPSFASNRFVYVYYTATTPAAHNRVSRITLNAAGDAIVGGETVLLDLNNLSGATNHNGGAIHFGPDGRLYVAVGDNASGGNSQSLNNLLGKILRINTDPLDVIPADNPTAFAGIAGTPTGQNRAIWAVGLRNPFTFAFQPGAGRMFINDVGQNTWEEINDGLAGANYGWNNTEGRFNQVSFPNFTQPLVAYHHTDGSLNFPPGIGNFTGFAISGAAFYTPTGNANFPISFQNDYFYADYITDIVRTFDPASNTGEPFGSAFLGVVDLALAPDSALLALRGAGGSGGRLIRVAYDLANGACCAPDGVCASVNGVNCPGGSTFIWGGVCSPNPCPQPSGACCTGSTCSINTADVCMGPGFRFVAGAAACNPPGNNLSPCCRADFNQSGSISVQDLFDFLAAYFFNSPTADINGSGGLSVQDLFDFLAAYFADCV